MHVYTLRGHVQPTRVPLFRSTGRHGVALMSVVERKPRQTLTPTSAPRYDENTSLLAKNMRRPEVWGEGVATVLHAMRSTSAADAMSM